MPETPTTVASGASKNEPLPLPELPSLGAMASRAVLSSHGHDELFGENAASTADPLPIEQIPMPDDSAPLTITTSTEAPIPDFFPQQKTTLNIPDIPKMGTPFTGSGEAHGTKKETLNELPEMDFSPLSAEEFGTTTPADQASEAMRAGQDQKPATTPEQEFTDKDLQDALRPLIAPSIDQFLYTPSHSIHFYLEPMLRSTVRRAIAEQMEDASPFRDVSGWDKFTWKLRALMGSRTYEDILFDQTRRYQVEEVFLLRPQTRSLISYASHDPSRHAKPGRVEGTVKNIATKIAHKAANDSSPVKWDNNNRQLLIRNGKHSTLAAIVHGVPNAILRADLDYALRQAEDRFGEALEDNGDIHLQILQPLLEGCLLIQSAANPN